MTRLNTEILHAAITQFKQKSTENPTEYQQIYTERTERARIYQSYTAEKIRQMTHEDFYEYIGKLWSMLIWGNKTYIVDKILNENGIENLKTSLISLLYGTEPIETRWKNALTKTKGLGPATISELLAYSKPEQYALFNKRTCDCLRYLGIPDMPVYTYQYTGKKYLEVCRIAQQIADIMEQNGLGHVDLLAVDYFLWDEILPDVHTTLPELHPIPPKIPEPKDTSPISLHNEIRDKIVDIGRMLGFESDKEIKVTSGAVVDAIWEASIGNMGKVIYVFEVQTKGSIDSLLLNLMKAKQNKAVQAIVAVSDEIQLEKIKREAAGLDLPDLKLLNQNEVFEVYESLSKAHAIINTIGLVPDSLTK